MDCPYLPLGGAALKEKVKEKKKAKLVGPLSGVCVCVSPTSAKGASVHVSQPACCLHTFWFFTLEGGAETVAA